MIISLAMSPMRLHVVISNKSLMDELGLLPTGDLCKVIVTHTAHNIRYLELERRRKLPNNVYYVDLGRPKGGAIPHNVEMSFNQIFPALPFVYPFFLNRERLVNSHRLFGSKDTSVVCDQTSRAPEFLDRCIEHDKDTGEILRLKDIARQDRPRKVLQDADDIKRPLDLGNLVLFNRADVEAPNFMTIRRFEGVRFRFLRLRSWFDQPIELPILCHDPATRPRTDGNPHRFQCGIHSEFPKTRILLQFANRIACPQIDEWTVGIGMVFVIEPTDPFFDPSFENLVDRRAGHLQIVSDGRNAPSDAACSRITTRRRSSGSGMSA